MWSAEGQLDEAVTAGAPAQLEHVPFVRYCEALTSHRVAGRLAGMVFLCATFSSDEIYHEASTNYGLLRARPAPCYWLCTLVCVRCMWQRLQGSRIKSKIRGMYRRHEIVIVIRR